MPGMLARLASVPRLMRHTSLPHAPATGRRTRDDAGLVHCMVPTKWPDVFQWPDCHPGKFDHKDADVVADDAPATCLRCLGRRSD